MTEPRWRARILAMVAVFALLQVVAVLDGAPEALADDDGFEQVATLELPTGEDNLQAAVIDPDGTYAYFGTDNVPAKIVKVELATLERVATITMPDSVLRNFRSAVIDPTGTYAYFGTNWNPGRVVKIDLATFRYVGSAAVPDGNASLWSAVMSPQGDSAYFASSNGRIHELDLGSFQFVDLLIPGGEGEFYPYAATIDPQGRFAYFGMSGSNPAKVVKIDLETFERIDAVSLGTGEVMVRSAVMAPDNTYAYFGVATDVAGQRAGAVARIDRSTMIRTSPSVSSLTSTPMSAVIHPDGEYAYFGTLDSQVVRVDLATFQAAGTLELGATGLTSAIMDPDGQYAYFGTNSSPGRVVKVRTGSAVVRLESVTVTPADPSVAAGDVQQFNAVATYSDASTDDVSDEVVWVSSDDWIATIDADGLATTLREGSATISASIDGVVGQTTLMVSAAELRLLEITPENPSAEVGATQAFTATGTYSDASTEDLTYDVDWVSSDASVATIDGSGLASAIAVGSTIITATVGELGSQTTFTVAAAVADCDARGRPPEDCRGRRGGGPPDGQGPPEGAGPPDGDGPPGLATKGD